MAKKNRKHQTPETTAPAAQTEEQIPAQETTEAAAEAQVQELRTRRQALLLELTELDGLLSQYQTHVLDTSVVQKPVHLCRQVFVAMAAAAGGQPRRRDVVDALKNKGVALNTARTQYQVLLQKFRDGVLNEEIDALNEQAEA